MITIQYPRFKIAIPNDWQDNSIVSLVKHVDTAYDPNIAITNDKFFLMNDLHRYVTMQIERYREELVDCNYELLKEGPVALNGLQAYECFHVFTLQDDAASITIEQWQVFLVFESEIITITCSDTIDNFKNSYPTFVEILNQFRYNP